MIAKPSTGRTRPGIRSRRHKGKNNIRSRFMKEGNGLLVHVVNRTGIVFVAALQSQSFFIVNVLSPF